MSSRIFPWIISTQSSRARASSKRRLSKAVHRVWPESSPTPRSSLRCHSARTSFFRGLPRGCVLRLLHVSIALEVLLGFFRLPQFVEDERQVILRFHIARIGCQ